MEEKIDISNISLASNRLRMKAFIIDDLLITFITFILLWQPISKVSGDLEAIIIILNQAFLQVILLKFLYQTFFIWYYGATIGKIFAKIRVINENMQRVNLTTSMIRSAIRIISENIFYLGFIIAYFTPYRQTLHDKMAKTLVVNV